MSYVPMCIFCESVRRESDGSILKQKAGASLYLCQAQEQCEVMVYVCTLGKHENNERKQWWGKGTSIGEGRWWESVKDFRD